MTALPAGARSFPAFLHEAVAAHADRVAVVLRRDDGEESVTYAELDRRSADLAKALVARGVGKGSRIGFLCGNGPRFAVTLAAIARIGAIAVPISTLARDRELARVLRRSDVAGLIVQRTLLGRDLIERLCDALPGLAIGIDGRLRTADAPYLRWVLSDGPGLPAGVGDLAALGEDAASVDDDLLRAIEAEVHPSDQMIEIYTSGAMALPKGVQHDHGPVTFRARWLAEALGHVAGEEVRAVMPMFWVGGLMMALLPGLDAGATVVCTERAPTSSKLAIGAVLAADDLAALPPQKVIWGLGMTETLGPYSSSAGALRLPGYPLCAPMDRFADGYEVRIADADGARAADGAIGEMQLRGYPVTRGIHKIDRSALFTDDGFYRTGDLCLRDGDRVVFVGRAGDMIKTAGANVSPAEVEAEMQALDGVHSAYVVGLPDAERGQIVAAVAVPRDGVALDGATLRAELARRLSAYKVPQAVIVLARDEVPMLFSNKVARRDVERLLAARLGRPA